MAISLMATSGSRTYYEVTLICFTENNLTWINVPSVGERHPRCLSVNFAGTVSFFPIENSPSMIVMIKHHMYKRTFLIFVPSIPSTGVGQLI